MRGNVHRQLHFGLADEVENALRDIDRLVAYALEVGVDLHHRHDEAEVHRHRLLHGQQVERQFVDLALGLVDVGLAGQNHLAKLRVAGAIRLGGAVDGLFRQASHTQQFFLELVQSLLKAASCHPNLPVM